MRAIRWLWVGRPLVQGLALALVLIAIDHGLGVRIQPLLFVAAIGAAALLWVAALFGFQAARFAVMDPDLRRTRLSVFQTGYGHQSGWYVERDGLRLALLTDPRFEDMFWDSYAVEPLAGDPAERDRIARDPAWWLSPGVAFRSREFGVVAPTAFVAGCVFAAPGRVMVRALYLPIAPPTTWERFWLWSVGRSELAKRTAAKVERGGKG